MKESGLRHYQLYCKIHIESMNMLHVASSVISLPTLALDIPFMKPNR